MTARPPKYCRIEGKCPYCNKVIVLHLPKADLKKILKTASWGKPLPKMLPQVEAKKE